MTFSIAHLGPAGTYAEQAAFNYARWLEKDQSLEGLQLVAEPSITQTIYALAQDKVDLAVVPVENSLEGGVSFTLDTLWQLDGVEIHTAFILPIDHMFVTFGDDLSGIDVVYSHPQPLGQCQAWLAKHLPNAQLIPTPSSAEGLRRLDGPNTGAIASERAALLNNLPIRCRSIQDHPDNCTKFWVIKKVSNRSLTCQSQPTYTSLAFSLPRNEPGALFASLETFANRQINLSRIESRPAKTYLGEYVFFIDAEIAASDARFQAAISDLQQDTDNLKVLGTYPLTAIPEKMLQNS